MLNRKEEALLRYQLYGGHRLDPWLGAFNRKTRRTGRRASAATAVRPVRSKKPEQKHAAKFIIDTVRQFPNEVHDLRRRTADEPRARRAARTRHRASRARGRVHGHGPAPFHVVVQRLLRPEAAPHRPACAVAEVHGDHRRSGRGGEDGRHVARRPNDGRGHRREGASPIKELFEEHMVKPYREGRTKYWFRAARRDDGRADREAVGLQADREDARGHQHEPGADLRRRDVLARELEGRVARRAGRARNGTPGRRP